ncbi:MAG: MerR family transcriptional regulator, partial [Planctomycetota bacterium]
MFRFRESFVRAEESSVEEPSIAGRRVRLVGRFVSVSRDETAAAIRRRGAAIDEETPNLLIVGEEATEQQRGDAERAAREAGVECIAESELWRRLGLVDDGQGVRRLYSPAMLAELVRAPTTAIRRWTRRGVLRPACWVNRLAYYDFDEARIAQLLSQLLGDGRGLAAIDSLVERLATAYPAIERPLAELPLVVVDGDLLCRTEDSISEASGQRCFDFDGESDTDEKEEPPVLRFPEATPSVPQTARGRAWELSDAGHPREAIEAWRLVLLESPPTADDHFVLAEWLSADNQHDAARERYYATLEIDPDHIEARVSLGCVLADQGEWGLAVSSLRGALEQHEEFADAHYHLARTHDRRGEAAAAEPHW